MVDPAFFYECKNPIFRVYSGQLLAAPILNFSIPFMRNNLAKIVILLAVLALTTTCREGINSRSTPPIQGLSNTLAVQTMAAQTEIANISIPPSPLPATPTLEPTSTPVATYTTEFFITPVALSTSFSIDVPRDSITQTITESVQLEDCENEAKFIADVTIPDEWKIASGEEFIKTWQLQNIGTCTWTPDYALVYKWGHKMGGKSPSPINVRVQPGEIAEISLDLTAPYIPACWQSNWMIQDTRGNEFGTGFKSREQIWILLNVVIPGLPDFLFG